MQFRQKPEWAGKSAPAPGRRGTCSPCRRAASPWADSPRSTGRRGCSSGRSISRCSRASSAGWSADVWRRTQPFLWGSPTSRSPSDALETFSFALRRCEAVLRDGTWVQFPTNLRVHPRDFKEALNASDGRLPVYLAIPLLRESEANTVGPRRRRHGRPDLRYQVEAIEASDENLGGPTRPIEIRKLSGRLLFGDESREGYETPARRPAPARRLRLERAGALRRVHPAAAQPRRLAGAGQARRVDPPPRRGQAPLPARRGGRGADRPRHRGDRGLAAGLQAADRRQLPPRPASSSPPRPASTRSSSTWS